MWDLRQRMDHRWAAGTYLDYFLASALMSLVYVGALVTILLTHRDWYSENMWLVKHIGFLIVGMGWLAACIFGMGFDVLPFVHRTAHWDGGILRLCIALNVSGQIALIGVLFTSDVETILNYGTVGVTLLSLQFVVLGSPAVQVLRDRMRREDGVGGFSSLMPLALPLVGVVTLASWLFVEHDLSRALFRAVLVDFFWVMLVLTATLGHFNRRLGWEIVPRAHVRPLFLTMVLISLVHILVEAGVLAFEFDAYTLPLLYAVAFLGLRPDNIWRGVVTKRPHSHLILAAHSWMLTAIGVSVIEIHQGVEIMYGRHIMFLGVGTMAMWGFAHWLHYDHCHVEMRRRGAGWVLLISMSFVICFYAIASLGEIGFITTAPWVHSATTISIAVALAFPAFWWFRETMLPRGDWHRIPMFYGVMHEADDPYLVEQE